MDDCGITQRIKQFVKQKGLTVQRFESMCGFSNGYVRSICKAPGADKIERMIRVFPDINREWLLNGEGEMLVPADAGGPSSCAPSFSALLEIIHSQQETIRNLSETIRQLAKSDQP